MPPDYAVDLTQEKGKRPNYEGKVYTYPQPESPSSTAGKGGRLGAPRGRGSASADPGWEGEMGGGCNTHSNGNGNGSRGRELPMVGSASTGCGIADAMLE